MSNGKRRASYDQGPSALESLPQQKGRGFIPPMAKAAPKQSTGRKSANKKEPVIDLVSDNSDDDVEIVVADAKTDGDGRGRQALPEPGHASFANPYTAVFFDVVHIGSRAFEATSQSGGEKRPIHSVSINPQFLHLDIYLVGVAKSGNGQSSSSSSRTGAKSKTNGQVGHVHETLPFRDIQDIVYGPVAGDSTPSEFFVAFQLYPTAHIRAAERSIHIPDSPSGDGETPREPPQFTLSLITDRANFDNFIGKVRMNNDLRVKIRPDLDSLSPEDLGEYVQTHVAARAAAVAAVQEVVVRQAKRARRSMTTAAQANPEDQDTYLVYPVEEEVRS